MRIVYITPLYGGFGGVQKVIRETTEALKRRGHTVETLVSGAQCGELPAGVRTFPYDKQLLGRYPYSAGLTSAIREASRTSDVTHCHQPFAQGSVISALSSRNAVLSPYWHLPASPRRRAQVRALAMGFQRIVCVSYAEAKALAMPTRTVVVRPGSSMRRPGSPTQSRALPLVLAVSLSHNKRPELIIETARHLKGEAEIALCGGAKHLDRLRLTAREVGLDGAVRGEIDDDQLTQLYGEASVFLTLSTDESFGLALYDAIAAGLTPVATDIPSHREIFQMTGISTTNLVGLDANASQIAATVRRAIRAEATEVIGRTWDSVAEDLEEVYESAIE